MSAPKLHKHSKFFRFMKGPGKLLARARDFYVRSLTSCAGNMAYGGAAVGCPNLQFGGLPRSFSANSSYSDYSTSREEDLRELVRVASLRSLRSGAVAVVARSRTVAIGRIDEDKPYEFGKDDVVGVRPQVFPRSKSYTPSSTSSMVSDLNRNV